MWQEQQRVRQNHVAGLARVRGDGTHVVMKIRTCFLRARACEQKLWCVSLTGSRHGSVAVFGTGSAAARASIHRNSAALEGVGEGL